jgi:hypothetical protein
LYHYTDEAGLEGILETQTLWASPAGVGDGFATHGPGQYLTDLPPTGLLSRSNYSQALFNSPVPRRKVEYWLRIDIRELAIRRVRDLYTNNIRADRRAAIATLGIYLRTGSGALPLEGRIMGYGRTAFR